MNVSLYQAAAALDANTKWQQMISENLAAASVPGFKKDAISFAAVQAGVMGGTNSKDLATQKTPTLLPAPKFGIDFTAGMLERTGVPSDVALEGPGYLSVRKPDGTMLYTRDGEFNVTRDGRMVNKDGFDLMGEGDVPIQVDPHYNKEISINQDGEVSQNGVVRGKLKLSEFQDTKQLTRMGSGYYIAPDNVTATPVTEKTTQVAQAFLEASNVQSSSEVGNLMLALRHFEANQKVIQMQDERMGKVIQEFSATS